MGAGALRPRAITSGQTKKRLSNNATSGVDGSGAMAQALRIDINDGDLLALFAVHRQPCSCSVRQELLVSTPTTAGAEQKPVLCVQFTTLFIRLQYFFLHFFRTSHKIYITPSQN